MIDQQFRFFNIGKGIAAFAQRHAQFDLALYDPIGIKRIARLDRERRHQPAGVRLRQSRQRAEVNAAELVAGAGHDIEPDAGLCGDVIGIGIAVFARTAATR